MSENDEFGANPFRTLKARQFPDKKKAKAGEHATVQRGKRVAAPVKSAPGEDISEEDCDLFLNAVSSVKPAQRRGKGAANTGFSLEERGALPSQHEQAAAKGRRNGGAGKATAQTEGAAKGAAQPEKGMPFGAQPSAAEAPATPIEDDAADFLSAMGEVSPLSGRGRDVAPAPAQGTPPPQGELSLQDFMDGKLEFALSFSDEYMEGHVVGLDQMIMNKLRSGGLSPEAHLDLHGLNALQAFEALRGFFRGGWYKGLRTVLIVPGRGRNSPDGVGVLRGKLQSWLTQDPFKRVVLAFCTAQPHDGGPGSVYVLLRKYRKKGRIYWERMPADEDLY